MANVIRLDANRPPAAILALLQESFATMERRIDPPSSLERMTVDDISRNAQDCHVLLIEEGNTPIACLFVTPKSGYVYLGKLAVSPSHQRKGLAARLVAEAEELARKEGAQYLELQTRVELVENHDVFGRMGFEKVGETSHPGFDRPTSITMRRAIDHGGTSQHKIYG